MLRTILLNISQKRAHKYVNTFQPWEVLRRHADDPVLLNRIGLFDTARRTRGGGREQALARARATLEWTGENPGLDPRDFLGRVSDYERQQYALALGRVAPQEGAAWLRRSESEMALGLALACGNAQAAQWHAAALAPPRRDDLKKTNNLRAVVAAQHCMAGQHGQARKNLMYILTNSGIQLPAENSPMAMDDFLSDSARENAVSAADQGLVSVIICAHNAAPYIDKALLSVQRQTYQNIEIVAIDDGSTDNTFAHLSAAASNNLRINTLRIENRGVYAARNIALSQSRGRFITFLDADDIMLPRRIEQQVQLLISAQAQACTSRLLRLTPDGRLVCPRIYPFIRHNPASLMMRREVYERLGSYEEVRFGADDEYEHRIRLHCGTNSLRRDTAVHTIALHHPASLTQAAASGLNSPSGRQARIRYREEWVRRHLEHGLSRDNSPLS